MFSLRPGLWATVGSVLLLVAPACQSSPEPAPEEPVVTESGVQELPTADQNRAAQSPGAGGEGPPPSETVESPQEFDSHSRKSTDSGEQGDSEERWDESTPSQHSGIERSTQSATEQLDGRPVPPPADHQPSETTPSSSGGVQSEQRPGDGGEDVPTTPAEVDDRQAHNFAAAYIGVKDLQFEYENRFAATTDPDELDQLEQQLHHDITEEIQSHDLTLQQFHAIGHLVETDSDLRDRIQANIDSLAH